MSGSDDDNVIRATFGPQLRGTPPAEGRDADLDALGQHAIDYTEGDLKQASALLAEAAGVLVARLAVRATLEELSVTPDTSDRNGNDRPQMIAGLPVVEVGPDFMAELMQDAERERLKYEAEMSGVVRGLRTAALHYAGGHANTAINLLVMAVQMVADADLIAHAERILGPRRMGPPVSPAPVAA